MGLLTSSRWTHTSLGQVLRSELRQFGRATGVVVTGLERRVPSQTTPFALRDWPRAPSAKSRSRYSQAKVLYVYANYVVYAFTT